MDNFLNKFGKLITGTIVGFDRIIFKGYLKPIIFAAGMQSLMYNKNVLNKDCKNWIISQSKSIVEYSNEYSSRFCGSDIIPIKSCYERKEALAHKKQQDLEITSGLIGVWSCVESCNTFKIKYNSDKGFPQIISYKSKCKHLYFYFDHKQFGFMSIRIQTWAPYTVQIALNGREWLKRLLDKENCQYILHGNKFLFIDDYNKAQYLLNTQLDTNWKKVFDGFIKHVFPLLSSIVGENISYNWIMDQSEWAKDYIFEDPQKLTPIMDDLLKYSLITGNSENILKYMGQPVKKNGQPHHASNHELYTRVNQWYDGLRVRFWVDKNSIKFYNEQNVFRVESTINNPSKFKIYRNKQNYLPGTPKQFLSMRKSINDIYSRTLISNDCVNRLTGHLATVEDKTPLKSLISPITKSFIKKSKKIRSLDITGKDLLLLKSVSNISHNISFITNKALQKELVSTSWANDMTGKRLSSKISRNLRLLCDHGLIEKVHKQRKYSLTEKGKKITSALNAILSSSTHDLLKLSA